MGRGRCCSARNQLGGVTNTSCGEGLDAPAGSQRVWPCICCRMLELCPPSMRSEERALSCTKQGACMLRMVTSCAGVAEVGALSRGRGRRPASGQWAFRGAAGAGGGLGDRGHQWIHVLCPGEAATQNLDRGVTAAEIIGCLFSRLSLEHRGAQIKDIAPTAGQEPLSRHSHNLPRDVHARLWLQALFKILQSTAAAASAAKACRREPQGFLLSHLCMSPDVFCLPSRRQSCCLQV